MDPTNNREKEALKCVKNVQTETNTILVDNNANLQTNTNVNTKIIDEKDFVHPPRVGKGTYPCQIGDCSEERAFGRMIPHVRYHHGDHFVILESPLCTDFCLSSWVLKYDLNETFDRVINIHKMGLFFLKLSINDQGNLYGNVHIVNTHQVAAKFRYQLEISNSKNSTSIEGQVLGCRATAQEKNCVFVNNLFFKDLFKGSGTFNCNLTIMRINDTELPVIKRKKKKKVIPSISREQ